jgi:sporulation protein YlmC with PRC-barrel domain
MAQIEKTAKMIRLSDTELTIANPAEDIRGRTVVDRDGEDLGEVEDLLIDEPEKRVRLLEVASGGFLGLGKTKFLLPVEAITRISDDTVYVNQTRQYIAGAPHYDPDLIHQEAVQRATMVRGATMMMFISIMAIPRTGPQALSIRPIPTMEKRKRYGGKSRRWV